MDDNEIWAAIDTQRRRAVELLEQLSDEEWRQPSLCDGWTVRDVAAHLGLQQMNLGAALLSVIKHPGGLNRTIRESARSRAGRPTRQLVDDIRATIGSRRHNVGVTNLETLVDVLVHGQDIAIPLGRTIEIDSAAAVLATTRVWLYRNKGKARVFDSLPLDGFTFTATDTEWSAGEGADISGPIAAILLLFTGRAVAASQLTGSGIDRLRDILLSNDSARSSPKSV